jgi:hypothetical protein
MPAARQKGWFKAPDRPVAAVICASKRFGAYSPEPERAIRLPQVEIDQTIQKLAEVFLDISKGIKPIRNPMMRKPCRPYEEFCHGIGNESFSATEIERFNVALPSLVEKDEHGYLGAFLSVLMNGSHGSEFKIYTIHLPYELNQLGFCNQKNIEVIGNAGDYCGELMSGGSLTIRGNAGFRIGADMKGGMIRVMGRAGDELGSMMEDGTIIVRGAAGDFIGYGLKGGSITVSGDACRYIGMEMKGGQIYLEGDFINIERIRGGRIFHRTRLIVDG